MTLNPKDTLDSLFHYIILNKYNNLLFPHKFSPPCILYSYLIRILI